MHERASMPHLYIHTRLISYIQPKQPGGFFFSLLRCCDPTNRGSMHIQNTTPMGGTSLVIIRHHYRLTPQNSSVLWFTHRGI